MNPGRGRTGALAVAISLAVILVGVVGCGDEAESDVVEGEPLELGDLKLNVQITRFLNPNDREDGDYLAGQQVPPPAGQEYLGVFIEIDNDGSQDARLPTAADLSVVDTTGQAFEAVDSDSPFALDLGGSIDAHSEVPEPDTPAASGPTQGTIVLFLVPGNIGENRPLELEVSYRGEDGTIELDI
ncbi:MAG: hypothetical protein ACRDK5_08480 [Solirubrobacterales bacterium]